MVGHGKRALLAVALRCSGRCATRPSGAVPDPFHTVPHMCVSFPNLLELSARTYSGVDAHAHAG
eukprot:365122-Chlamydomonas_euryale.AAC.38